MRRKYYLRLILVGGLLFTMVFSCKTAAPHASVARDTGISGSSPENQRSSAFCWAYAVIAHLEQRYYEETRGATGGGFRLNFSEEYLGLVLLMKQLMAGEPLSEGLRLSDSLALVDRYGIVPEKIGGRTFFKPIFDFSVSVAIFERAYGYWQEQQLPENSAVPAAEALKIVGASARLSESQINFLGAAMGIGPIAAAQFSYANKLHTPQSWAKERLKFSASDYYTLTFPDSGRGQFGDRPMSAEYALALKTIKKAMLYGYSIPISFNFVSGSKSADGVLGCIEKGCWDADIAFPTPSWPHANHAVLLVDYRSADSSFLPVSAASLQQSLDGEPSEWVIKNSWGFNSNASQDPDLLRRFPLPAYTIMTQDFFEAGHKLRPGLFEALIPKNLCLRGLAANRPWICKKFLTTEETQGIPRPQDVNLALNTELIVGNIRQSTLSRYPVQYDPEAVELPENSPVLKLSPLDPQATTAELPLLQLTRQTTASGPDGEAFSLCAQMVPASSVKYVAIYYSNRAGEAPEPGPKAIVSGQNNWRFCLPMIYTARSLALVLQPLNERYRVLGQIRAEVRVEPTPP